MKTSTTSEINTEICLEKGESIFREDVFAISPVARRDFLRLAGTALAAGAAFTLAACGSAPRRRTTVSRAGRSGTRPSLVPRAMPQMAATDPLFMDPWMREEAVARAMLAINAPYRYGGNTLETGFDCSGLVQYAFSNGRVAGRAFPRSTAQWARASRPIDIDALQRGDLVFFNTLGASFSHMGIYVGGRQFVHAPSSGKVVSIETLDKPYYITRFNGARTVFAA